MRMFVISLQARDRTGGIVAAVAGAVLATQITVNLAMVTGLAPTTGITLPLMSYGGSSVMAVCIMLGIVQNVWRLRYANVWAGRTRQPVTRGRALARCQLPRRAPERPAREVL